MWLGNPMDSENRFVSIIQGNQRIHPWYAKCIYRMIVPDYIFQFKGKWDVQAGFNKFCLEHPEVIKNIGADGLYGLVWDYFYDWWKLRHRHQVSFKRDHTDEEWELKKKEYGYKCAYCELELKLTKDHILPISLGVNDKIENIVPACKSCNSKKGNREYYA